MREKTIKKKLLKFHAVGKKKKKSNIAFKHSSIVNEFQTLRSVCLNVYLVTVVFLYYHLKLWLKPSLLG